MRNLDDVALDPLLAPMITSDADNFLQPLVFDISSEEYLRINSGHLESPVKNEAVFVSVNETGIV